MPVCVWNDFAVSKSQRILPSMVEYGGSAPSVDPENTPPGIPVTACDWACDQAPSLQEQGGVGADVCQRAMPVLGSSAHKLPVALLGCASSPERATNKLR